MISALGQLLPYFLGAFALLAFLPGWRSWLAGGAVALAVSVWLDREVRSIDGPAIIFAAGPVVAIWMGFITGFIARGAVLAGRAMRWKMARPIVVLPLALIGVPAVAVGVFAVQDQVRKARLAPPSTACLEARHTVKIGDVTLALPVAPVISMGEGEEYFPSWQMEINQQAREFCDHAGRATPMLTNLTVDLRPGKIHGLSNRNSAFCSHEQAFAWWSAACRTSPYLPVEDLPQEMTVYVMGRYNAQKMHAASAEPPAYYAEEIARLPARRLANGVAVHANDHTSYFVRADRPGFVARCHLSGNSADRPLYCVTGQVMPGGLGLKYDFYASEERFAELADLAKRHALAIFDSLKAPSGS